MNRQQLYALGEPLGESVTRTEYGKKRIYGGGGGGKTVATTSTSTPSIPAELKPLANLYAKQAQDYAYTPYQAYGGQRFAGLDPTQALGIGMVQERALGGSQTMRNAEGNLNQFIQGGQTNPYLDQMVSKAQGSVVDQFNNMTKPQIEAAGVNSGSFGNTGYQQMMQQKQKAAAGQMSDIATQMYGGAYGQDQANRMQAIQMAPTFGDAPYRDAGQLLQAGNILQQESQNPMDFQYQQFREAADHPLKQMQATSGVLGQNMGSTTSGTQPKGGK